MNAQFDPLAGLWSRYAVSWTPHVSQDGTMLAWSWSGPTDTANVWVAPTDGSAPPRRITDGSDHFFVNGISADGKMLILAQGKGGNEHDRLFRLDFTEGAVPIPLTRAQHDHYVFGGTLHPDGRSLLYTADYDDESGTVTNGSWLYVQDLPTGVRRILARAHSIVDRCPEISPDGKHVLYHRGDLHPAGTQIWLVNWDGSGDRQLYSAGERVRASGHWLDDGRILLHAETETHARLGILDLASGAIDWIIDDPARGIETVVVGHDGRHVALLEFVESRLAPRLLDLVTRREHALNLPGRSLAPLQELPDGSWIAETYSSTGPHAFVRIDPTTGVSTTLAQYSQEQRPFTKAQDFRWTSGDGEKVQGWLYEPAGDSRGLIVWVHGGPTWHSEDWAHPVLQCLVQAGFTVLDPNYRGSTGFGRRFRELIKQDGWGGREQDDIRAGIEALIEAGKAQRGRIGVAGLSYGGYSSWVAITRFADLVDAVCPICGMYELGIDYHKTEMPHGRAYSEEMMGGTPEQFPERFFNASPRNFVDRIKGRLMIVHGMSDTNVSPANTDAAIKDLDARGMPYRLLTFPDEGHGIYKAGNRARWLAEMADFFAAAFTK